MSVLRRLIYREVFSAVAVVTVAFLGLFFFFDAIDELPLVGKASPINPSVVYEMRHALLYVVLQMPSRVYEVLPIAVLIGGVWVFARLAQNSEYTILRTSGLGPWRALRMLLGLGLVFVAITFITGDHIAPAAGKASQLMKARFEGHVNTGPVGAWLKERRADRTASVNVWTLNDQGEMQGIRLFEYDLNGRLLARTQAKSGTIASDHTWQLRDVIRSDLQSDAKGLPRVTHVHTASLSWPSTLTAEMVSVALLQPDRMSTLALYGYIQHLNETGQSAQLYELGFWRKVFYPLSCLVMLVLALPFAYLHFRAGGITGYVFGGVMVGISFFLLNNVFGYIGRLNDWTPWLAAASPSLIYSLLSLTAFGWLVLRR